MESSKITQQYSRGLVVGEFGEVEVAGGDEHEVAFAQGGAIAVYFYGHRAFGDIDEFGGFVVVDQDRDAFR